MTLCILFTTVTNSCTVDEEGITSPLLSTSKSNAGAPTANSKRYANKTSKMIHFMFVRIHRERYFLFSTDRLTDSLSLLQDHSSEFLKMLGRSGTNKSFDVEREVNHTQSYPQAEKKERLLCDSTTARKLQ